MPKRCGQGLHIIDYTDSGKHIHFSVPFVIIALLLSLLLAVVSQIRCTLLSLRTMVRALHFYRDNTSALSPIVGSRRIAPTPAKVFSAMNLYVVVFCIPGISM